MEETRRLGAKKREADYVQEGLLTHSKRAGKSLTMRVRPDGASIDLDSARPSPHILPHLFLAIITDTPLPYPETRCWGSKHFQNPAPIPLT